MKRFIPTSPGRYWGRWGNNDWQWFEVTKFKDDLVTRWDGQTWYVINIYFQWKEQGER